MEAKFIYHYFLIIPFIFLSGQFIYPAQKYVDLPGADTTKNESDSIAIKTYLIQGEQLLHNYPDSALKKFIKAETLIQQLLDKTSHPLSTSSLKLKAQLSEALINIGNCYAEKVKLSEALDYFYKSLKIREDINDKNGIAEVVNNIGLIYGYYLKENENALKYLMQGLKLYKETGDKNGEATALHNVAALFQQMGDTSKALNYYFMSLKIRNELEDKLGTANSLHKIATLYQDKGDTSRALEYYIKSLKIRKEIDDKQGIAYSLYHIAALYFSEGKLSQAKQMAEKSLAIGKKFNYIEDIRVTSFLLQKILKQEKRWKEAYTMFALYSQITDSTKIKESHDIAVVQQAKYEYEKRLIADSIKYNGAQREKDLKISQQKALLHDEKNVRNSIIIIMVLVLITSLLLFNRYRINLRQKQNKLQIAALEMEQSLMRAQMNPHFIYNSLNSIQCLILENEPRLAREYLIIFSRLTRAILEQTRKRTISLSKEIETLRFYLDMEKLRFNNKFNYEINLLEINDLENISIPPLVIQPFVENSILHGISHKTGNGKINIEFRRNNGTLRCIIEDDGIGRRKAEEINSFQSMPGLAVATQLAQKRLALMNENHNSILITDLFDKEGNACGTRTDLSIRLTEK